MSSAPARFASSASTPGATAFTAHARCRSLSARSTAVYAPADVVGLLQVEARARVRRELHAALQEPRHLAADLAAGAGDEHAHQGKVSAPESGVPAASLGLRTGAASSGQATPIAGAFHSTVRSCSGA